MEPLVEAFRQSLESLDRLAAEAVFDQALEAWSPIEAVERVVVPALEQMGDGWETGEVALSQYYLGGRLCDELVARVLPPSDPDRKHQPRAAITALNDYHLLGKRIVYSLVRAGGFDLFDYGRMDVDELIERCVADRIRVLLISVLMLPSALKVRAVCDGLKARGMEVKVLVGGAPFRFDRELWREVGADAMGDSASDAVTILGRWMDDLS